MRYSRQNKILEIISNYEVDTQEKLVSLLMESGFHVTQATISRDIKDLQLIKTLSSTGRYKYSVGTNAEQPVNERLIQVFKDTIMSVASSGNMIVLKTLSGCANAAAEALDSLDMKNIVGTIAGDNTIFVLVNEISNVPSLVNRFNDLLRR